MTGADALLAAVVEHPAWFVVAVESARTRPAGCARLTNRQLQVALCRADLLRYRDIARLLSITDHTVKSHIEAVYRELGCTTRGLRSELDRYLATRPRIGNPGLTPVEILVATLAVAPHRLPAAIGHLGVSGAAVRPALAGICAALGCEPSELPEAFTRWLNDQPRRVATYVRARQAVAG